MKRFPVSFVVKHQKRRNSAALQSASREIRSLLETRSPPDSLAATLRAFAFYLGNPFLDSCVP
jgi:hypothetical protein